MTSVQIRDKQRKDMGIMKCKHYVLEQRVTGCCQRWEILDRIPAKSQAEAVMTVSPNGNPVSGAYRIREIKV